MCSLNAHSPSTETSIKAGRIQSDEAASPIADHRQAQRDNPSTNRHHKRLGRGIARQVVAQRVPNQDRRL